MTDRYQRFATTGVGHLVVGRLGLPDPVPLRRYAPGQPLLTGPALVGATPGGRLRERVTSILTGAGAEVRTEADDETRYGAPILGGTRTPRPPRPGPGGACCTTSPPR